ncbi:MAG: UDP-N-acetylmuramate--L-alanine ligase [Oligoflexales bacterium]|nr:UDP-N-acetylmuramate--L-alanine ligase [Oligoflexales bacterium]
MKQNTIGNKIHFIGIGGSGMSPIAQIALHRGFDVSGSDIGDSATISQLRSLGAKIFLEHKKENISEERTIILSSAIQNDNPEVVAAQELKYPIIHRSDFLSYLMKGKKVITVAGTHGKTTTSAIIAHMLHKLNLSPTAAIGGKMVEYESSALCGDGEFFVAEADESDGTLLKYESYISILTNIDHDHMDFFKNFDEVLNLFSAYLKKTDPEGISIIGWDDSNSRNLGAELTVPKLTYGTRLGSEVRAINHAYKAEKTTFTAIVERELVDCEFSLIGKHNVLNALCALAVAKYLNLNMADAAKSISSFKGVNRRLTPIFKSENIKVYDDYAHNPGKIMASIDAIRYCHPKYKIYVVYQPHRFTRLDTMYNETMASFKDADHVFVLPVYAAGEKALKAYSSKALASDIQKISGTNAEGLESFDECIDRLLGVSKERVVFLTVGAGDVFKISHKLGDLFNAKSKEKQDLL